MRRKSNDGKLKGKKKRNKKNRIMVSNKLRGRNVGAENGEQEEEEEEEEEKTTVTADGARKRRRRRRRRSKKSKLPCQRK